jgi:hypothetical protein
MKQHRKYSLLFYRTKNKKENLSTFLSFRKGKLTDFQLSFFLGKESFYFPFLSFLKVKESESTTPGFRHCWECSVER